MDSQESHGHGGPQERGKNPAAYKLLTLREKMGKQCRVQSLWEGNVSCHTGNNVQLFFLGKQTWKKMMLLKPAVPRQPPGSPPHIQSLHLA